MTSARSHAGVYAMAMIAAASIFLQPGCRSVQVIPGQRLAVPGSRLEDFSKQITSHLFENGMMIGVGNDDRFLYVFFTPDIRHRQRPFSRVQLTLWLDENGGKAHQLGLVHISGFSGQKMPRPEIQPAMSKQDAAGPADRPGPEAIGTSPVLLKIIDNRRGKEFLISVDGSQGPSVRLAADWGDFAYQWRIPFQGAGDWPGLKGEAGRVISIGLLWQIEALDAPGQKNDARLRGGPGPGGPGMGTPSGMEGDGPGPGRGLPGETPASKRKLWVKTRLLPE